MIGVVIVKVLGGLGNQMLQYAFYKKLIHNEIDAKLDINDLKNYELHNGYELDRLFSISPKYATLEECYAMGKPQRGFFGRIKRKLIKFAKNFGYIDPYYEQNVNEALMYLPEKMHPEKDSYYFGYWTSYKYFEDIMQDIRRDFTFIPVLDVANQKLSNMIQSCNSVSLHIRRGDYLLEKNTMYRGICTEGYYENAIKYVQANVDNPFFFVFSNDIEWCRKNVRVDNVVFVDINHGVDSYKDMQLMSICKHNIIANSTFSLWGGTFECS